MFQKLTSHLPNNFFIEQLLQYKVCEQQTN